MANNAVAQARPRGFRAQQGSTLNPNPQGRTLLCLNPAAETTARLWSPTGSNFTENAF